MVDDKEGVRRGLERLLRTSGFQVQTFGSGDLLLASLRHQTPDCVLLDIHMPGMDGLDVLLRIVELESKCPVLFITDHDTPQARERVARQVIAKYLWKPLDDVELLEAILASIEDC